MPREIWPVTAAISKFKMAAYSLKALYRLISVSTAAFVKVSKAKFLMLIHFKIYFSAF